MNKPAPTHTLVVMVDNIPGVLSRVAGLFSRRGFNIASLAVAPTDDPTLSRITVVVVADSAPIDQIKHQLFKLINVVEIRELTDEDSVERELILVAVSLNDKKANDKEAIQKLAEKYDAKIISESSQALVLAMDGSQKEVDALEGALKQYGIIEIQRTGKISISGA